MADWEDAPARSTSKGGWEDAPTTTTAPAQGGWKDAPTPVRAPAPVVAATPETDAETARLAARYPRPATAPTAAPADNLDARLAAQEAKRKEFSFAEEATKGAKSAFEYGLPSMGRQVALQGSADAMMSRKKQLDLMDKIDSGAYPSLKALQADPVYEELRASGANLALVGGYYASRNQPEIAAKMRGSTQREFDSTAADTRTHIDTLNKYARENKAKYGPRVEKFTDIDWTSPQVVADFTNWLGSNMGAGAVQLAPVMLAAVTLKQPGLLATSGIMGVSEAVGNRMKFIQDQTKGLPPEQQGEAIAKYVAESGDANLITGLVSGSFDLILGPAAKAAKVGLSKSVGEVGKVAAMKKAAKELPKDIRGEAATGALQESTQIAAKKILEEQGKPITLENIKDVINAAAAEGAGAPAGTAINVGMAGLRTPSAPKAETPPKKERIEPTMDGSPLAPAPVQPAPPVQPTPPTPAARAQRVQELTERMTSRGFSPEEAADAAELRVATEERELRAREEKAAAELPTYYPKIPKSQMSVEETLFREYLDEGVPPEQAREMAQAEALRRAEDAEIAKQQGRDIKKGKKNVAGPDTQPTGASVPVDTERPTEAGPAASAEGLERDGVVSAEQDAGRADDGEGAEPGALTAQEQTAIEQEDAAIASFDDKVASAKSIVKTNFDTALDQVNSADYNGDLDAALDAYRANALDTLNELGETDPDVLSRAEKEFDKLVDAYRGKTAEAPTAEAAAAAEATDAAVAEVAAPKAKRGRKPYAEDKRTQTKEEQDKVEAVKTKADYELRKGKNSLTAMLDRANNPDPNMYGDMTAEEAEQADIDVRQGKRYAVRRLIELAAMPEIRGTAVGKRINAMLNDRSKISQQEITDAKKSIEVAKQALADKDATLGSMVEVQGGTRTASKGASESRRAQPRKENKQLTGTMTGAQALTVIAKTGSWFQKLLANRLRKFIGDVKVVVLEKGDPLPQQLIDIDENPEGRWNGLFLPGTKPVIYVTGASFGKFNGQNNITVLHELLHAVLNNRIFAGMGGYSASAKVFTDEILKLMEYARTMYNKRVLAGMMDGQDLISDALRARVDSTRTRNDETGEVEYAIFTSPDEFLSYALTEDAVQDFLKSLPSLMAKRAANAFSDFVQAAAKVLGLGKGKDGDIEVNALTDLIEATDGLLNAQYKEGLLEAIDESLEGDALESLPPEEQKPGQFSATAYKDTRTPVSLSTDVKDALNKVKQSRTAEEIAENSMVANIKSDPKEFLPELMSLYNAADGFTKRLLLNFATTDFLAEEWGGSQVPRLVEVNRSLQEMHGMAAKLMEGANKVSNVIFNEFNKNSDIRTPTETLALAATLAELDPSTDKRSPDLNRLWNALPEAGKKVYNAVRDFYEDMSAMHSKLLNDQIGNLDLTSDVKKNLLAKIKALYEVGDKIVPYFALVRRGDYWLRVGSGAGRQFYMFTTPMQRDRAARAIAKQRRESLDSLRQREVIVLGNDISSQRKSFVDSSPMLTELFDLIDDINLDGLNPAQVALAKEDIKDAIYQLYLISMPEQRLRKQFIHREGITGFSTDLMRNFSDSATSLAMQLSRIKYAPQVRNSMSAAQDSVEGQPNLEPFVEEMQGRVQLELGGGQAQSKLAAGSEAVVNFLNRGAFVHYLSSASSAILQPLSIAQFGMPILGARYGYAETGVEFMKALKVWNLYGVSTKNADGSVEYTMPSMRNAPNITPLQRRAMDAIFGRDIGTATLTADLMARGNQQTDKSLSMARRYLGNAWWFGSGGMLMHASERMSQELLAYMSFNLNQAAARKEYMKTLGYKNATNKMQALRDFDNANFQKWIDRAVMDTHESLANMTQLNRPPVMRGNLGKALTQFQMFGLHNTILIGKNMKRMIAPLPDQTRTEAAKTFFGIMGTTVLLGGASGLGIALTFIGFLAGMWDDWWEDEDKKRGNRPEGLRDLSFIDWFKGTWLPNTIGGFIDKGTEEGKKTVDELTALVARGGLNAATGADFSSRLGILNLSPRDSREGRNIRESVGLTIEGFYPPTLSQGISYAEAVQLWMSGDNQKAFEKAAPASVRSLAIASRLADEGAKTNKGVPLQSADSITKGELIWRAVGFNSDKLADTQSTNYRMNQIEKNINNERLSILEKFKDADRRNDFDANLRAGKAANKFNRMYPSFPRITQSTVADAVQGARESRGKSFMGVEVNKANAPFAVEAIAPSRRAIMRAEQEAIEKKKAE